MKLLIYLFIGMLFSSIFNIQIASAKSIELDSLFNKFGFKGSFVLLDNSSDEYYYYNKARCKQRFSPASTFKIPNSLIALENNIINDADYVFKYNGEDRWNELWRQDLTLKDAMKYSCVPCYQELARKIGKTTMQQWLNKFNYGNKIIGNKIDEFWLNNKLQISQIEQIEFLKKFYFAKLGVSNKVTNIVKSIIIYEQNPQFTISGKTGTNIRNKNVIGWYVGYLETKGKVYFFGLNVQYRDDENLLATKERVELTYSILRKLKLID
jgi:beta-lactamase class D